jgi:hypothetical protein
VPTIAPIDLWQFGEQELLLLLLLIPSPSFCEDLGHMFKTEQLFCKCVGFETFIYFDDRTEDVHKKINSCLVIGELVNSLEL